MDRPSLPPIIPADGVVFTCQRSGACCRHPWLIGVDEASHARLADVDWARLDPALPPGEKFRRLALPLATGETLTFARRADGACVFLTDRTTCAIQNTLGWRAKPQVCREFPYQFVQTPDGVVVGLSFACTAVRAHRGRPLAEQGEEIRQVLAGSYRVRRLPEPLTLFPGIEIGWEEYRLLEAALLGIFGQPGPFPVALLGGSLLIALAVSLKKVEARAAARGAAPRQTMAGALAALAAEGWAPVLRAAAGIRPPARRRLAFLAPLYTWLEFSTRRLGRVGVALALYRNYLRLLRGRGRLPDPADGRRVLDVAAVERVAFVPDEATDAFLREYWSHVLFRKTLTPMHGVFRGYQTLLLLYAFMKWLARVRAAGDGRAAVALDDVKAAVLTVEQRLILHARFADLFDLSPFLTAMADRFFQRLSFPRAAVLEPAPRDVRAGP